jgi:hypothetical protein
MSRDAIVGEWRGRFIYQSTLTLEIECEPDFDVAPGFEFLLIKAWCNNCGRHSQNEDICSFCGASLRNPVRA